MDEFLKALIEQNTPELLFNFSRRKMLHGTPFVFLNKEEDYFDFQKIIGEKFNVHEREIYIVGSGKLGFSPHKNTTFDENSDIDVAIVSPELFEKIMKNISQYEMSIRRNNTAVTTEEMKMYHKFLRYTAIGWIRPDKLPTSFQMKIFKDDWFEFFNSISYGKSVVGDYKVSAGVFRNFEYLETYIASGFEELRMTLEIEEKT